MKKSKKLLAQLTLDEKIAMIHGAGLFVNGNVERLGIPSLHMSDGPSGVRQEFKNDEWVPINDSSDFVSWMPSNTCIASTWNRKMARKAGNVLGDEARGRGKDVILAPGINIKRTPLCGRNFEYMSEDPYLTGELAVPLVEGIQKNDVAACVKHFALNNQEFERMSCEATLSERALYEIYLPAFKKIAEHAYSIMGAYNQYVGEHCCENKKLIDDILHDEWNYDGLTISDWGGVHNTQSCGNHGMDIEMSVTPDFDEYYMANPLKKAVEDGLVSEEIIDLKVLRILKTIKKLRIGDENRNVGATNTLEHQMDIQKIAEEGVVLLKNETSHLPLSKKIKKIAVIGDNATRSHANGGGSSEVKAQYDISPLLGMRMVLGGDVELCYHPGYYIDNEDKVVGEVDWQATSLAVDYTIAENKEKFEKEIKPLQAKYRKEAVALAKECDEVIFIGGLNHAYDVEGFDRPDMNLPYGQDTLIKALLKANPETTVVLIAGSPVTMKSWLPSCHSLIQASYCGMRGGYALARILFGEVCPSGHIAETYPLALKDCAAHRFQTSYPGIKQSDGHYLIHYEDDIWVGYRNYDTNQIPVAFPFGHGLSYGDFKYQNMKIRYNKKEKCFDLYIKIKNTSQTDAKEVVQVYVGEDNPSVKRPAKELKAFEKIMIPAGNSKTIHLTLGGDSFAYYDEAKGDFVISKGTFHIYAGRSVEDIRLEDTITLGGKNMEL